MPAGPAAARRIYSRFIMGKETLRVNKEGTIFSQFARYVSLNVLSMAGLSCYILADTYFISAGVGSNSIAALNLALPAYSLLNGIGLMVGMGGATRYSILRGEGREDEANQVFTHAAGMAALLGILFTAAGLLFSWEIAGALGASGQVQELASIYLRTLLTFSLLFLFNNLLVCFIRNDGQPNLSMAAMLVGCLSNVVLDYVFIFPLGMGMFGAALATCVAPCIGILISSTHFLRGKNSFRPVRCPLNGKQVRGILSLGVSSLITEVSSGIVMLLFNQILLSLSGNVGGGGLWNHRESGADRGLHLHRRGPGNPAYRQPQLRQRTDAACEADLSLRRHHGGSFRPALLRDRLVFLPAYRGYLQSGKQPGNGAPGQPGPAPLFPRVSHDGR